MVRSGDWSFESEPGLTVGEKITPIASAGLFTPSGKASYPSVTYQLVVPALVAGVPQHRRRRAAGPRRRRRGRSRRARRLPQARPARRVPGQRPGRHRRPRVRDGVDPAVRKVVGPGSPAVTIAQVEMQRHGVTTMMLLGPTESVVIADGTADPARLGGRSADRGRARHRHLGRARSRRRPTLAEPTDAELARSSPHCPTPRRPRPARARRQRRLRARRHARRGGRDRQSVRARAPPGRCRRRRRRRRGRRARRTPARS